MAQESIKINNSLLKHLRNSIDEIQEHTAEACDISLRQYQNIESKGKTSSLNLIAIAEHFDITPKELTTNINRDDSFWYITEPYLRSGRVEQGYYKALEEIKNQAKSIANIFSPKLVIKNNEQLKEITLSYNENDYCWTMRPIILNKKIGLVWSELSDWQEDDWNHSLDELIYGCVYDVHIDGSPLMPDGCSPKLLVQFNEVGKNKKIYKGYRIFNSDAEFRVSLTEWLDSNRFIYPSTPLGKGGLHISYGCAEEMSKSISIYRVWLDEEGRRHQAPWPTSDIEKVIEAITDTKGGRRQWAIPIGASETFHGEPSPMTPEMICNEVTELPEIKISFEDEQLSPNV